MSVIQKIRDKYGKIAGAVIGLALVGFIIQDAASGRFRDFFGNDTNVAKVNGKKIDNKDYQQRVSDYELMYEVFSDGRQMDAATRAQINNEVLDQMVYEKLIAGQQDKLGIQVSEDEQKEMFRGANPDPMVQQFFVKIFGAQSYDPQMAVQFEKSVPKNTSEGQRLWERYDAMKRFVLTQRLKQKFDALVANGIYTPKFLVDRQAKDQNTIASVRYVKVPYTTIEDSKVPVSESDVQDYLNRHKAQFTIDVPTRSIDYLSFDIIPSSDDTSRSLGALNQLKPEFAATSDVENFVNRNSDIRYNNTFVTRKTFQSQYADSIINQPVGVVYGPYYENGAYRMARLVEKKTLPDSVTCRHILIQIADQKGQQIRTDSVAKKLIDSIVTAINTGASFDSMVVKYSDDPGSKDKGGKYDFTLENRANLTKEFGDFIFDNKPGDKKVVKADNKGGYSGYHYIEILSQKSPQTAVQVGIVSKDLTPSQVTNDAIYAKATEFAGKYNNGKAFDEGIKKEALNKRVAENVRINDFVINGLGSAREIVRWMYDAKVGDVSNPFALDGRYIVAKLSGEQEAGLMKLDNNSRPQVEAMIKMEKKAKLIGEQYKNSSNNLDAISAASKQPVLQADSFNANAPYIPNLGFEPKVVGYSFFDGFKPGTVSPAIQGSDGVFYLSLISRTSLNNNIDPNQLNQQKVMTEMQLRNSVAGMLQDAFKKGASIKYSVKNL